MGNYRAQYERYYGNVKSKGTGAKYKSIRSTNNTSIGRSNNVNIPGRIATKLIWQFGGAVVLLGLLLIIKTIPIEGTKEAYTVSKKMIDEKFNINEAAMAIDIPDPEGYKEKVLDYIDEAKSFMVGGKTLKETIKEEYMVPTIGKKKPSDDNKGVIIVTNADKDVNASYDGVVREVNDEDGSKNIVIDNDNGVETYYGLLSEVQVNEGDEVKKGQSIGKTGSIDSLGAKGMIFKIIYMGNEKDPNEMMDLSSLEEV